MLFDKRFNELLLLYFKVRRTKSFAKIRHLFWAINVLNASFRSLFVTWLSIWTSRILIPISTSEISLLFCNCSFISCYFLNFTQLLNGLYRNRVIFFVMYNSPFSSFNCRLNIFPKTQNLTFTLSVVQAVLVNQVFNDSLIRLFGPFNTTSC